MHSAPRLLLSLIVFCWLFGTGSVLGQQADYRTHPTLDFRFLHLGLAMEANPEEGSLTGEAAYDIRANVDGGDTLALDAAHMEIESVSVDGGEAEYRLHNDSLLVAVSDSTVRGNEHRVEIIYRATPRFGLLKNDRGTVWTSGLPLSNRHWVPLPDHPRAAFSVEWSVSLPSGYRLVASGVQTGEEVESADRITYRFASETPVPAPALTWAAGRFGYAVTDAGEAEVAVYHEEGAAEDSLRERLAGEAADALVRMEESTQQPYPHSRLNVVLLDDHHWETRTWGAATVFLYRNAGSLRTQLLRGVAAQWFGVRHREEQWGTAEAMNLYQTLLLPDGEEHLLETEAGFGSSDGEGGLVRATEATPYAVYAPGRWNAWQRGYPLWERPFMKRLIRETLPEAASAAPGVYGWEDYAERWYRSAGQPLFDPPYFVDRPGESTSEDDSVAVQDSVAYRVDYRFDEQQESLTLTFRALNGMYEELTAIRGIEVEAGGSRDTSRVTFTGREDSVVVSVSPLLNTFRLEAPGRPELHLEQHKPAPFLIYELRNAGQVSDRVEAARGLGEHTDNPDLQLAIQDYLGSDISPEVRAALLSSLSSITGGASGTEQRFLEGLESPHTAVRRSSLMALQNFTGNEQVLSRVQRFAMESGDREMFRNAARVLSSIAGTEQLSSFTDQVVASDTSGRRAIFAVSLLASAGGSERAVAYADQYTSEVFDYEVRSRAIRLLDQFDRSLEDWRERAESLLEDADPRIRYLAAEAIAGFEDPGADELLKQYLPDEYDARVREALGER